VGLRQAIEAIFSFDATLEMAKHAVIVPAFNLTHGEPQVFKTKHNATYHRDYRYRVIDIALATSAAPVFFPIAELDNQLFADGGLFANAPDLAALHEAEKFLSIDPTTIRMLSIGTTTSKHAIAHDQNRDFGAFQWMQGIRLLDVVLSAQRQLSVQIVRHRLADRYMEIDNQPAAEVWATLGLDRGDQVAHATLRGLASRDASTGLAKVELGDMLTHLPRRWIIPAA
jgi:patatin-like phospholipase/acyl hydrolase